MGESLYFKQKIALGEEKLDLGILVDRAGASSPRTRH
jgi:hypothetical protein